MKLQKLNESLNNTTNYNNVGIENLKVFQKQKTPNVVKRYCTTEENPKQTLFCVVGSLVLLSCLSNSLYRVFLHVVVEIFPW